MVLHPLGLARKGVDGESIAKRDVDVKESETIFLDRLAITLAVDRVFQGIRKREHVSFPLETRKEVFVAELESVLLQRSHQPLQ
jgi:hypothetical protein